MNNLPNKKFVTQINCMDGRAHPPVTAWLKVNFDQAEFFDTITEPGAVRVLAEGKQSKLAEIREHLLISVNAHGSGLVAVVGHHDCAANPVPEAEHRRHIEKAVAQVRSWNLPVKVLGLWLNDRWQIETVVGLAG